MPTSVIVPDEEQNNGEGKESKNLFFTGDNLEVLRHLQANYTGKIDVIYIDPPYNTGNGDFVYPDNFDYTDSQLKEMFGLDDDEVERMKSIQGSSSHSAWLTFMYPRLFLAKKLLSENGCLFVSIDDNEQANLKLVCDEVFGEADFVDNIVQKHRSGVSNDKIISENHNLILFYVKNIMYAEKNRDKFGIKRTDKDFKNYNKDDKDGKGKYTLNPVTGPGGARKGNPYYEFLGVRNYWRFSKANMERMYNEGKIVKINDSLYQKTYKSEMINKLKGATTWWDDAGTTSEGTKEIKKYFKKTVFDFPKPTKLIVKLLRFISLDRNALVLDFFAGSSTTADAVMQLNAEDGGNRKFIMVQLPEKTYTTNKDDKEVPTKGGKAAYDAGFRSIDEISRERIRRAAAKIKEEKGLTLPENFDGSFKHYRVVKPNTQTLKEIDEFDPNSFDLFNNMLDNFSSEKLNLPGNTSGEETVLTTWLAADGYSFDADIKELKINDYIAHIVENNRLYLIKDGWTAENTKTLINLLGTNQLAIQSIVLFGYSFNIAELCELENALKQLDANVNLIKRY